MENITNGTEITAEKCRTLDSHAFEQKLAEQEAAASTYNEVLNIFKKILKVVDFAGIIKTHHIH